MIIEGQEGPAALADGARVPPRLGKSGEVVVTELHGKFYEQNYRGNLFTAANAAAGTAISVAAGASSWTLWNPINSGRNLVVVSTRISLVSGTLATGGLHYAAQINVTAPGTLTVAPTVVNALLGNGNQPVAKAYTAATFTAAPVLIGPIATKYTSPTTGAPVQLIDQPDGSIIIAPGSALSLVAVGADTAPLWSISQTWEEVPI